jgi:hypothetical protein
MSKHFEMLPEEAFQKIGKSMKLYKKGGGGPTETSVQQSNIPEYAQPYVESMLGAAQQQIFQGNTDAEGNFNITGFNEFTPYSSNMNDYVAGFSPLQQQAQTGAANLAMPGQFGTATGIAGASGYGSLGMAGQLANTGRDYANQATNPNAVRAYMNPYLESSLAPQIEAMRRQYGITGTQQQGQATQAGAFGGSREALMASENNRAMNSAIDAATAQGYNNAFNNAQAQMQYGSTLGLQGGQAALQGLSQAGQAASTLGNLGANQLAAEQGIIGTQNQFGTAQQQAEQQKIDQAIQNYAMQQQAPMQSLAQMSGLLRGLPLESTTTQSYQAGPGALQSLAGIGTGIAGVASLAKAEGGTVKSYANGGIVGYADGGVMSQANAEGIAQGMVPQQLEKVQSRTLPDYIRIPLLNQKIEEQKAAQQAMAAQQGMADQESLKQMVLAQAEDLGITSAQSNLPDEAMMAGGGIVSFVKGGLNAPEFPYTHTDLKYDYLDEEAKTLQNQATGKGYTYEEKAAERRAKEKELGIRDLTEDQLKALKTKEDKLSGRESRAQGLGLLAASQGIMSSKGPGLGWLGAGLGAYGKTAGAELEKVDALRENYAQQGDLIRTKQMDMKRAEMTGDTAAFEQNRRELNALMSKKGEGVNANITAKKAAELEAAKARYGYQEKMDAASIAAASAHNTDLRWLTNVKYEELVAAGAPPDKFTKSKASSLAANEMGKIAGSDRLDLDTSKLSADVAGKIEASIAASDEIKGWSELRSLEMMKKSRANPAEIKKLDTLIKNEKARISKSILGGTAPVAPPAPPAPAPGGNKPAANTVPLRAQKIVNGKTVIITSTDGGNTWKDANGKVYN